VRRILISLAILVVLVVALSALWIFGGRQISLFLDRFGTIEITSMQINSLAYEGSGTGGVLRINDLGMGLNDRTPAGLSPSIGSTKDGQFALATGGKVFPFGPLRTSAENAGETLAATPSAGDDAFVTIRRSALSWLTPFDFNFMTGHSPSWKRHLYYRLLWKKRSGANLEMLWRYEQYFYPGNGWGSGFMTHEGSTGQIRIDISP
jgi:hypothetical protein